LSHFFFIMFGQLILQLTETQDYWESKKKIQKKSVRMQITFTAIIAVSFDIFLHTPE